MATKTRQIRLKWYTLRRVRVTGEYGGGILAGFGMGIALSAYLAIFDVARTYLSVMWLPGLGLIAIGGFVALHAQGRYVADDGKQDG